MLYYSLMKTWNSPAGKTCLKRYPFPGERSHQAWDAADEWITRHNPELADPKSRKRILITGEAFGVLGTVWGNSDISALNDSLLSQSALNENRAMNPELTKGALTLIPTTGEAQVSVVDKIFIRLPKSLEMLEIYIRKSLQFADADTEIWIGGMDKRWNRGVQKITERYLTVSEMFPFERHARWLKYSQSETAAAKSQNTDGAMSVWQLEKYPLSIISTPAVFSGSGIDSGTAAFIDAFPEAATKKADVIADAGCGSGILGLCASYLNPEAKVIFTDESYLAVEAAEKNHQLNSNRGDIGKNARFLSTNGLKGLSDKSIDLFLCNPPFHYQNIQSPEPAKFLFSEAKRTLKPGGTIQIVGNSHLGYHKLLKEYFYDIDEVYRNSKFIVIRAAEPTPP